VKPRVCCHPGCETIVDPPHVLCLDHWRALPARVQSEAQYRLRAFHGDRTAREAAAREYVLSWLRIAVRKASALI
jgi:hypothetical protein